MWLEFFFFGGRGGVLLGLGVLLWGYWDRIIKIFKKIEKEIKSLLKLVFKKLGRSNRKWDF